MEEALPAGRNLLTDYCKKTQTCVMSCAWQTPQQAELSACREHGNEKPQKFPIVSSLNGWEDGSALNSHSDQERRSSLQGKIMNCLDMLSLTNLEHIQLSGFAAQEKQKVLRDLQKGTLKTMKRACYGSFPL